MSSTFRRWGSSRSWVPIFLLLLAVVPLFAQSGQVPPDLSEASIEQLLSLEVVSAGRKQQPLSQTPAAIFVLSGEEIRRSGAQTIPEALRLAPGMQVARLDTSTWAVSARGPNGEFANKLLVMIDGRGVYTPVFGGVYWDSVAVPIEDIDRIEIIRGPGGTMWGANATNGVVNIITKPSRETLGSSVVMGTGSSEAGVARFRYGARAGSQTTFRLFGTAGVTLPLRYPNGIGIDSWNRGRIGFRSDTQLSPASSLVLEGDVYAGNHEQVLRMPQTQPPYARDIVNGTDTTGGFLLARLTRGNTNAANSVYQVYFDRQVRSSAMMSPAVSTLDGEYQRRKPLGRHDVLWGGGARLWYSAVPSSHLGSTLAAPQSTGLLNGFMQDEVSLTDTLRLTAGGKLEYSSYAGTQFQPGAQLLWTPSPRRSIWTSFSRAVRAPSRLEREVDALAGYSAGQGIPRETRLTMDPGFGYEKMWALEAGWRGHLTKTLTADVSLFQNWYSSIGFLALLDPFLASGPRRIVLPVSYRNGERGLSRGVESWLSWNPKPTVRIHANYTWMNLSLAPESRQYVVARELANGTNPTQHGSLQVRLNLPRRVEFDTAVYAVSRIARDRVPGMCGLTRAWDGGRPSTGSSPWQVRIWLKMAGANLPPRSPRKAPW